MGAASIALSGCLGAASVTPLDAGSDGAMAPTSGSHDGPGCYAARDPSVPSAVYAADVAIDCGTAESECEPSDVAPRLTVVDFAFPCDCDPSSDPVLEARFAVSDADTPNDQLVIQAVVMGCAHSSYVANGTAFASDCGAVSFASGWNVLVQDPQGHTAVALFNGPATCASAHYVCRPMTSYGGAYN